MQQENFTQIICELTHRALWEVRNVIACVPEDIWNRPYCEAPLWKHIYHMLHSLDLWYVNPRDTSHVEPPFPTKDLNNLDVPSVVSLTRAQIDAYADVVCDKIRTYAASLTDVELLEKPMDCEYTRFTLILAQFRHLHTHLGMLMGFIIEHTGEWPYVVGLEHPIPEREYGSFC